MKIIDKTQCYNQNNILYFFDNSRTLLNFSSEKTLVNNVFKNNLSSNEENTFFLNTYGSLYAVDNKNLKINWFVNLNQSTNLNPSNLFFGNQIVNDQNKIVVSSNQFTFIIDIKTGSVLHKKNFSTKIKPFIINNYLFGITKKDYLIALNLTSGNILYSYDINQSFIS